MKWLRGLTIVLLVLTCSILVVYRLQDRGNDPIGEKMWRIAFMAVILSGLLLALNIHYGLKKTNLLPQHSVWRSNQAEKVPGKVLRQDQSVLEDLQDKPKRGTRLIKRKNSDRKRSGGCAAGCALVLFVVFLLVVAKLVINSGGIDNDQFTQAYNAWPTDPQIGKPWANISYDTANVIVDLHPQGMFMPLEKNTWGFKLEFPTPLEVISHNPTSQSDLIRMERLYQYPADQVVLWSIYSRLYAGADEEYRIQIGKYDAELLNQIRMFLLIGTPQNFREVEVMLWFNGHPISTPPAK